MRRMAAFLVLLASGSPALRAQDRPAAQYMYGMMSVGYSASSRNHRDPFGEISIRRALSSHVALGPDVSYHPLTTVSAIYVSAPCPVGKTCGGTLGYAGQDLVVAQLSLEGFEVPDREGFFGTLGIGPAYYVTYKQPAQTQRWSLAVSAGGGLALPLVGGARIRFEAGILQLLQPAKAPTRVIALRLGLQVGAAGPT